MRKLLHDYVCEYEDKLNTQLMNKEADIPLVEYIVDAFKSLEIVPNIKFLKYEYDDDESGIDINKHIFKRDKKTRKKDKADFKLINDDRVAKLSIWMQVTLDELDPKTNDYNTHQKIFKKDILIPTQDKNGNIFIKGKKYYIIYQLLEKSTYTTAGSVTLKSLMPIVVKRESLEGEYLEEVLEDVLDMSGSANTTIVRHDMDNTPYTLPVYNIVIFKKEIPVMLFYATRGLGYALSYLGVDDCIKFVSSIEFTDRKENHIYFLISSKCYLEVYKPIFLKYQYVQSIVGGILNIISNRFTISQVDATHMWIKKLGNGNNYEKGMDMLTFFQRLLDETTKKTLKVSNYHITDIYSLLRWMMMNFNDLRLKDNMSLDNKRLRCNEQISALLTIDLSRRLNRIISLGAKVTMSNFAEMFKFPGDILLQKMHKSGILRFNDCINDMDFFTKFKVTSKGQNALGGKNSNNINIVSRGLHPSYIGNFDLLVCGNSDPGTSFVMSPFCNIDGLYFNNDNEPDEFMFSYKNDIREYLDTADNVIISVDGDRDQYIDTLSKCHEFTVNNISIDSVPKFESEIIIDDDIIIEEEKIVDSEDEDIDDDKE